MAMFLHMDFTSLEKHISDIINYTFLCKNNCIKMKSKLLRKEE